MNALTIAVAGLVWFFLGYKFYGGYIERRFVTPNDANPTPAHTREDGVDFVPSRKRLLWGNHFASIAGAGPIIGPILAVSLFGWGPALLWVAVGAVFMGATHDYLILILSIRDKGRGIADLAGDCLGDGVKRVFALLLFLMLMLLVAVFMVSVAEALIFMPALVIPTFGLVGVAVLMGLAVYRLGMNDMAVAAVGVVIVYVLIWVGWKCPLTLPAAWGKETITAIWLLILSLYCLLASVAPIWLLLQPRDFISSVKLWIGMGLGFLGLAVSHPVIDAPFATGGFVANGKPLWPMLFIIVACGAISGFHSLVSTGTTARQVNKESDAKGIAFGGMISEGVLAMLVILVVASGLKWGMAPAGTGVDAARDYFGSALAENWIVAFAAGFGNIVEKVGIPGLTVPLAALVGAVMVKSFILTTLDAGTRLSRLLISDACGERVPFLKNRTAASLVVLVPAYALAVSHAYSNVWRLFGAVNQLVAAVVLIVITIFLTRTGKPRGVTLIPAAFMLATTEAALLWEMFAPGSGYFTGAKPNYALGALAAALIVIGGAVTIRALAALGKARREMDRPTGA